MLRRLLFAGLVIAVIWLASPFQTAATGTFVFQTDMFGQQMVPPVNTQVWGFIRFFFNDARTEADFTLDVKGVSSNDVKTVDMFRGAPGTNGVMVRHLSDGGFLTFGGHLTLSASELADFVGGQYYVVLTTKQHPQGEIRGQVYAPCGFVAGAPAGCTDPLFAGIPDPVTQHFVLSGPQPPPPPPAAPPPTATGSATIGTSRPAPTAPPLTTGVGISPPNTGDGGLLAGSDSARAAMVGLSAVIIGVGLIFASGSRGSH
ncbi:MAG TPA: CHRD domain-containing protein [Dehalococcoidia bacterium]|jgi:hypothetical protein